MKLSLIRKDEAAERRDLPPGPIGEPLVHLPGRDPSRPVPAFDKEGRRIDG